MKNEAEVFIVDDDDDVRDSLRALLESEDYAVQDFSSAGQFLKQEALPANGCLVVDIRMPEMDGLELQAELAKRGNGLPIIIVTGHGDVPLAVRAMKMGAVDFIEKPYSDELLLKSVRRAIELNEERREQHSIAQQVGERLQSLTPRERDVLDQLVLGHPNKIIAYNLSISPRTVEIYRANLMEKMQARSLSDLIRAVLSVTSARQDQARLRNFP